jgi:hypothetical protein
MLTKLVALAFCVAAGLLLRNSEISLGVIMAMLGQSIWNDTIYQRKDSK